jgi:hypothetical protein
MAQMAQMAQMGQMVQMVHGPWAHEFQGFTRI